MSYPLVPIGAIFSVRNGATPASGEGGYWDGDIPWVTPADLGALVDRSISSGARNISVDGYENCGTQMVPAGSVILSIRAPIGHMAIAQQPMCFNQGCRGLVPSSRIRTDFAYWALVAARLELEAAGQGTTFIELGRSKLRTVKLPLPDLDTQKAIAATLDRETARIDQLIAKKQRIADLIAAKREALIHEARGENGAKWVRFSVAARRVERPIGDTEDSAFVPLGLYNRGRGFFKKTETDEGDLGDSSFFWVQKDDIVFSGQFAWEGAIGFVSDEEHGCVVSHRYPVYRSTAGVEAAYLFAFFRTAHGAFIMENCSRGAAGRNRPLNPWSIERELVLIPSLEVQKQVAALVHSEAQARRLVSGYIKKAQELRSALVTAVVTGQLDIREKLPAVTTKPDRTTWRVIVGAEIVHRLPDNPKRARVKVHKLTYLAEAHFGLGGLQGNYLREAAGPLDRALREETERGLEAAGYYRASQTDGTGTAVTYTPLAKAGQHKAELDALLGPKADDLRKLIATLADLDRRQTEAVATLYAVWNDALMDGQTPDDAAIINGVLNDWHTEKGEKFTAADLAHWLAWMKRHDLIPRGQGPRTTTGRLFV